MKKADAKYKDDRIDYKILGIEKEPTKELKGNYEIIIATNIVHATTELVKSLANMKKLLKPSGVAILSEITKPLHWHDLVFGLLDGWWNAKNGREYSLQSPDSWFKAMKSAGFSDAQA